MTTKTKYLQLKIKHQEELNAFDGIFFAFSGSQFAEGLAKLDIEKENLKANIVSLGSGGFLLKSKVKDFSEMFKRHNREMKQLKKNHKDLLDAITYELRNHEYGYTYEVTDALEALGLDIKDVPADILTQAKKAALD
jgi:hypothetical protein